MFLLLLLYLKRCYYLEIKKLFNIFKQRQHKKNTCYAGNISISNK